jgi:hypothetical protein
MMREQVETLMLSMYWHHNDLSILCDHYVPDNQIAAWLDQALVCLTLGEVHEHHDFHAR